MVDRSNGPPFWRESKKNHKSNIFTDYITVFYDLVLTSQRFSCFSTITIQAIVFKHYKNLNQITITEIHLSSALFEINTSTLFVKFIVKISPDNPTEIGRVYFLFF